MTVQGILTQAAGYVQKATTYVVEGAKTAYVAFKTAVNSTEGPMKGVEVEKTGVATTGDNAEKVVGGFVAMANGLTEAGEVDIDYDNAFAELISSNFSSNPVFMSHYNKGLEASYGETFATDGVTRVMDALLAS